MSIVVGQLSNCVHFYAAPKLVLSLHFPMALPIGINLCWCVTWKSEMSIVLISQVNSDSMNEFNQFLLWIWPTKEYFYLKLLNFGLAFSENGKEKRYV